MDITDDDAEIGRESVEKASYLVGGYATNLVVTRAELDGRPVTVIAMVVPAEDPNASFIAPMAVIFDEDIRSRLTLSGQSVTPRLVGESDEDFLARTSHQNTPAKAVVVPLETAVDHDPNAALDAMAQRLVEATGGLGIHSEEDHFCVHLGPPGEEDSEHLGCRADTLSEAVAHAFFHHTPPVITVVPDIPEPGDPRLN